MSAEPSSANIAEVINRLREQMACVEAEARRANIKYSDDHFPMVIMIEDITSLQARKLGLILGAFGLSGVFQEGPLAEQLVGQWCHPKDRERAPKWKRRHKD